MSNAFTNFLGSVASGIFDSSADVKTYQHADRLYVKDTYARSPKLGFLYYVIFDINRSAVKQTDLSWLERGKNAIGFLVKSIDLPKFNLTVDEVNQYNRKTLIQTKIKYTPISVQFHDDNSNIITKLWKSYYQYYYADSNYGKTPREVVESFGDTKYSDKFYTYGLANYQRDPFFKKIDIYVFHQQKYSQYTLVNPLVSEWAHDTLEQDQGTKTLSNKMTVAYENVIYNVEPGNKITKDKPEGFKQYYDQTPSPLSVGGNGTNTLFGPGGVIAGADNLLGSVANAMNSKNPLDILGAGINAVTLGKNIRSLNKAGLKAEGYSIVGGILGNIQSSANQPNGVGQTIRSSINNGNFNAIGQIGVGLFQNATVDKTTTANIKKLIG